ncbi:MAG: SDR family oxidoreductase [Acidimicrobiia bacterium]|nr:SDR family oxidoreductase [Acidimicrobiia bacterium]MDH5288523.1 SDR family oxidoreductase [Acidimicrobiia bacterium]
MDVRLDGRTALVTGGSSGLGRAMALEFARSGASVAILARNQVTIDEAVRLIQAEAAPGSEVAGLSCDVGDGAALSVAHAAAVAAVGPIDIVVNNAGTSAGRPFEASDDDDWQHDLDLKVLAAIRLIRLCLPHMKEQRWGRIINVLNIGAKAPGARSTPTSVSRAAGMALTKSLAAEYAPHNILVNGINTGVLVTSQWHRLHQERAPELTFEAFLERQGKAVPLGRMGDPAEFANLACFLASDKASYITGTSINVDGGLSPVI